MQPEVKDGTILIGVSNLSIMEDNIKMNPQEILGKEWFDLG
jgi:hypothetical protein